MSAGAHSVNGHSAHGDKNTQIPAAVVTWFHARPPSFPRHATRTSIRRVCFQYLFCDLSPDGICLASILIWHHGRFDDFGAGIDESRRAVRDRRLTRIETGVGPESLDCLEHREMDRFDLQVSSSTP